MVSPAGVGSAAVLAAPSLGPSLQDVLAALRPPGDEDDGAHYGIAARGGGCDGDEEEEEVSPSKFLLGLFDDDDDDNVVGESAAAALPAEAPSSGLDPAMAPLWDDTVALSFPSARRAGEPQPDLELVASSSGRRGSATTDPQKMVPAHDESTQLVDDLLGADEIEQLATGMLEMGSPMMAVSSASAAETASSASDAAIGMDIGRPDGVPSSTTSSMMVTSRMRMASSWHLGPGANANANSKSRSKVKQEEDSGNAINSSGRRILPVRKARINPGIEYDDAATPANNCDGGTKRRSSGESAKSVASVTSADGKPGKQIVRSGDESGSGGDGTANKKRKRSSSGSGSGSGGGTSGSKKPATTKKKADAIAKKAAANLGLDPKAVPQRPKQAPNTFILFCNANRSRIKAENPNFKPSQMSSLLGEQWKALSDRGRKPYVDAAAKANKEYAVKLEAYNTAMERFRETDDGKRWVEEQDRLLRQSVEEEGGVWDSSMGIGTKEKEDEEKAIAAVVAAAAAVKAQEDRQLKAKAALQRQEEEKLEKDRQLFEKANIAQLPCPPIKPKSAFSFFSDALYEKRSSKENRLQLEVVTRTTCTSDEDDSSCPAILYDRLPQQEKEAYEVMANKAQKTYQKVLAKYEQELETTRSRAREIIDMLDPKKRAAKVDQMIREVAAVRRQTPGHADWFLPDRQRLVRHQLDWRLRHAAKAGCTQAEFSRNLTMLYSREGREQEEKRRLEQIRLQREAQEKRIMAETEKMKQLQEQMQRAHQLQQFQQLEAAKQATPYPGYHVSQAYYPHQAYPWGVMMPTQMPNAYASYSVPAVSEAKSAPSQNTGSARPVAAVASGKATSVENNNNNPLMALAMLAEWNDQRAQSQPSAAVDAQSHLNGATSEASSFTKAVSSGAKISTKEAP